jgi:uncharacterized cupredoxin-like copper-binding protein
MLVIPATTVAGALVAFGCGSDSGTTTVSDTSPAPAAAAKSITIDMGEYYYKPKAATARAGSVTITATNSGKLPHELVLAHTDAAPAKLPTLPDGSVDEAKLEAQGKAPGEIPEVAAGKSGKDTLKLPAGRYVMYCNIPGHYAAGMYGTLITE